MKENTFWGRARPLIKALNMTQKQFADHVGISFSTLKGWMFHDRVPELSAAFDIAYSLGVSLEYLLSGKDRTMTDLRLKEIELRRAAGRLLKITKEIEKELKQMRPLP